MADTPQPDPGTAWISAHLFHRGSLDDLITGAIAPLIEQLTRSGALAGFFFLRYWEGGPHLRLRLLPRSPQHAEQVRGTLLDHGTRYLSEHPSPPAPAACTAEAYRAQAQRMALAERLREHDPQLHPDDTVELIAYRPEYSAYGQRPALTAVEIHFTESSTLALDLLTTGTPAGRRHAAALAMLMLTLAVCEPDLARITSRLRGTAIPDVPGVEDTYQHTRHALHQQARELWAHAHQLGRAALSTQLAAWLHSMRTLHTQLATAHAQGRFTPADSLSPLSRLTRAAGPHTTAVTQVLLRCTHLLCNRLGIHRLAEAHIVSLMTRTLTDLDPELCIP